MSDEGTSHDKTTLDGHEIAAELLEDWRLMFSSLHARFETGDFATGLRLVDQIGAAAEKMDHHPDLELSYPRVDVRLTSHDVGGVTRRDIELARRISEMAASVGATPAPSATRVLELGLDTWDHEEIKPFWAAVLGYESTQAHGDELVDPDGTRPTIWFQQTERHEEPRQRFHLDLRVPPEEAESRIAAALEAGGAMVSEERAPTFWVLGDAQGNKVCLTTWVGRSASA